MTRGRVGNRSMALVWLAAVATGCGSEVSLLGKPVVGAEGSSDAAWSTPAPDTLPVASSLPAVAPLGFGRPPTAGELAELDIDVFPDGRGLPPGAGTAEEGEPLYRTLCASCHGPLGRGTPAGWPLVGRNPGDAFNFNESLDLEIRRTIGNYWPYAPILFDFTRRSMPADRPGSLSDDEVYALTAWMLWMNDLIAPDAVMDSTTLPEVEMPARDRFVPDDRPGHPFW